MQEPIEQLPTSREIQESGEKRAGKTMNKGIKLMPRRVLPSRFCFVFAAKNEEKKKQTKKEVE